MRKGVVLKIKNGRAIIMADDCTFCEIKSFKGMYTGMEVCFKKEDILKKKVAFRSNKYINAACFILFIFCSYLFLSFYNENIAAYAYIGIDINPSVEIALNKKGKIIDARGLDEEGKGILEELDIKNMDTVDGVRTIITKSIEKNYLDEENSNEITVYAVMDTKNSKDGEELIEKVEKAIEEEVASHDIEGEIRTFVSDRELKTEADKKGMSVAQYIWEDEKEVMMKEADKKEEVEVENNKNGQDKIKKEKVKINDDIHKKYDKNSRDEITQNNGINKNRNINGDKLEDNDKDKRDKKDENKKKTNKENGKDIDNKDDIKDDNRNKERNNKSNENANNDNKRNKDNKDYKNKKEDKNNNKNKLQIKRMRDHKISN